MRGSDWHPYTDWWLKCGWMGRLLSCASPSFFLPLHQMYSSSFLSSGNTFKSPVEIWNQNQPTPGPHPDINSLNYLPGKASPGLSLMSLVTWNCLFKNKQEQKLGHTVNDVRSSKIPSPKKHAPSSNHTNKQLSLLSPPINFPTIKQSGSQFWTCSSWISGWWAMQKNLLFFFFFFGKNPMPEFWLFMHVEQQAPAQ
jgi:hypothetical protein